MAGHTAATVPQEHHRARRFGNAQVILARRQVYRLGNALAALLVTPAQRHLLLLGIAQRHLQPPVLRLL